MIGNLLLGKFGYTFREAQVQDAPGARPKAGKALVLVDETGVEVVAMFVGAEQWAEFQRQVAEEKPPSDIEVVPGHMAARINGRRRH